MNEIEKLKEENKDLKKYIERMDKPEIQVIDAEILTLKEENAKLNAIIDSYQPRLQRYKDILQEIKEIAEIKIDCKQYEIDHDCFNDTRCKALRELIEILQQILDLITKAEEE